MNKALYIQGVADEMDYTKYEFTPSTWTLYVKYADAPSQPAGVETGPQGPSAPLEYVYAFIGVSAVAIFIALIAFTRPHAKRAQHLPMHVTTSRW